MAGRPSSDAPSGDARAGRPGAAVVRRLTATAFRNYDHVRLEVEPASVVLTGPNGAGKTNLLEALSFLAPGRGLRSAALSEVARIAGSDPGTPPSPPWAVAARLILADDRPVALGTGRDPQAPPGRDRRVVQIDGAPASGQAALGRLLAILWLTPDMEGLFRGPAGDRRRFLDRLVAALDPDHTGRAAAYAQAQRERARLLRDGAGAGGGGAGVGSSLRAWLSGLEEVMARHGVALAAARRDLLDRLASVGRAADDPFPGAILDLDSEVDGWLARAPALEAEDRLRAALSASRAADAQAGATRCGPHRDDLRVVHADTGRAAGLSSTGEQKALLIALLLAQARVITDARAQAPLLLLDEVAAHLDARRRAALAETLAALGAQAWITGTDPDAFVAWRGRAQFLRIDGGAVVK